VTGLAGNQLGNVLMAVNSKFSLEVINFRQELDRIEQEMESMANLEIRARIDYATSQLKLVTPVDTGKARSGWYNRKIKELDGTDGGFIINEVEYVGRLNSGSSTQAPKNFIEQVLIKIGLLTPN
jgi:hypothetical protein